MSNLKTSEFVATAVAMLIGLLSTLGVHVGDPAGVSAALQQIIGAFLVIVPAVSYLVHRTRVTTAAAPSVPFVLPTIPPVPAEQVPTSALPTSAV